MEPTVKVTALAAAVEVARQKLNEAMALAAATGLRVDVSVSSTRTVGSPLYEQVDVEVSLPLTGQPPQ